MIHVKTKYLVSPLWFVLILLCCAGCQSDPPPQEVRVNNRYAITLLGTMQPQTGINEHASLQYTDLSNNIFIIVIDEERFATDIAITEYFNLIVKNYYPKDSLHLTDAKQGYKNDMEILSQEIIGMDNKKEVYIYFTLYKSQTHFYQVVAWTTKSDNSKTKHLIETMVFSFRELTTESIL